MHCTLSAFCSNCLSSRLSSWPTRRTFVGMWKHGAHCKQKNCTLWRAYVQNGFQASLVSSPSPDFAPYWRTPHQHRYGGQRSDLFLSTQRIHTSSFQLFISICPICRCNLSDFSLKICQDTMLQLFLSDWHVNYGTQLTTRWMSRHVSGSASILDRISMITAIKDFDTNAFFFFK